jgi:hypothetical protein
MTMTTTFVVEDVFTIVGRGPVVSRSQQASKDAWSRGERWRSGNVAICGSLWATVTGVERHCVAPTHPAHNDGALLLDGVEPGDLHAGQIWERSDG